MPLIGQSDDQVSLCIQEPAVDRERPAITGDGFIELLLVGIHVSEIALSKGEIGLLCERGSIALRSLGGPPRGTMHVAQVVERLGVARVELQRPPVQGFGFGKMTEGLEHCAQIGDKGRLVGLKLHGLARKPQGLGQLAVGQRGHCQKVQRVGLVRLERKHAAIKRLGLIESPCLMMLEPRFEAGDDQDRPFRVVGQQT